MLYFQESITALRCCISPFRLSTIGCTWDGVKVMWPYQKKREKIPTGPNFVPTSKRQPKTRHWLVTDQAARVTNLKAQENFQSICLDLPLPCIRIVTQGFDAQKTERCSVQSEEREWLLSVWRERRGGKGYLDRDKSSSKDKRRAWGRWWRVWVGMWVRMGAIFVMRWVGSVLVLRIKLFRFHIIIEGMFIKVFKRRFLRKRTLKILRWVFMGVRAISGPVWGVGRRWPVQDGGYERNAGRDSEMLIVLSRKVLEDTLQWIQTSCVIDNDTFSVWSATTWGWCLTIGSKIKLI